MIRAAVTFLILLGCMLAQPLCAQVDFNHYRPLRSEGNVPEDFSLETSQKIKRAQGERRGGLTTKEQRVFVEQVNYTIDELLKSGLITYGDPVSAFVQRVGERLTASDDELRGKLRFYVMNINEANAFSTDQGMVFVTTGLIAQMTNEAQLAFVLAHEIVHYQEEHVLDLYDYVMDNKSLSYSEKIRFFSKYSRDNEFEADKLGVALYHKAGYASSEITRTFDILIYSYLPFEELSFPKNYFNTDYLFVPEQLFSGEKNEITAKPRYNDRYMSHPNVAKRTEALNKAIEDYQDWGTTLNSDGENFEEVRTICRFEFILNDVYDNNTIDALYAIFVMEQQFPDSRFLRRCKAQLWLEAMKQQRQQRSEFMPFVDYNPYEYQHYEGEISLLSNFFGKLPEAAIVALGLRVIHDLHRKDTTDALMATMREKAVQLAAMHSEFEPDEFSKYTFTQAILNRDAEKQLREKNDSLSGVNRRWDKYETIKNTRAGLTIDEGIDSTKFYYYSISDLISDSLFHRQYKTFREKAKAEEEEAEAFFGMTDAEQTDFESEEMASELYLGLDTLLLLNPYVLEVRRRQIDFKQSEVLEERLLKVVEREGTRAGVVVNRLDRSHLQSMTTRQYNDLAFMVRTVAKGVQTTDPDVFMIDQEWLDSLRKDYGTSKVMLLSLEHAYNNHINAASAVVLTILFPIGMVYIPIALLTAHSTVLEVFIMDLEKGQLVVDRSYYSREQVSEKMLSARCYALFNQLTIKPHESN